MTLSTHDYHMFELDRREELRRRKIEKYAKKEFKRRRRVADNTLEGKLFVITLIVFTLGVLL